MSALRGSQSFTESECLAKLPSNLHKWREEDEHGCWIWQGARNPVTGYAGATSSKGYGKGSAYRLIWQIMNDTKLPKGFEVVLDHLCDRGKYACVNPNHLVPSSHRNNVVRSPNTITGKAARATHCVNGHEFTPENTIYPNKNRPGTRKRDHWRACKTCRDEQRNSYRKNHTNDELNEKRRDHYRRKREQILAQKREYRRRKKLGLPIGYGNYDRETG